MGEKPKLKAKRYWVFRIDQYYPCGGLGDLAGTTDDLSSAIEIARDRYADDIYIWDIIEDRAVWEQGG